MIGTGYSLNFKNPISDAVSRIRFAPQSNNLLISSWEPSLRLYDVDCCLLRFEAPSEAALLDCCFQGESAALSAGSDGCIRRYDLHSGLVERIGTHQDIATCVGYSDETCQLISTGLDKTIMAWDIRSGMAPSQLINLGAEVESMSISGSNLTIAVGASVYVYDLRNLERPVHSKESRIDVRIRCVSSIPYSGGYAVGSVDGRVTLEFLNEPNSNGMGYTFRCFPKFKDGKGHLVSVNDIAFSSLSRGTFVTGDNEGYVAAWDFRSKKRLYEFPRCPNSVASLSYNNTGQLLAIASSYTYQEANEIEVSPQIFIHKTEDSYIGSFSARCSSAK